MQIQKIDGLYHSGLDRIEGREGWYYTFDNMVDFYEVKRCLAYGDKIPGNMISFFFYPQCRVYTPFEKQYGVYYENLSILYYKDSIYFLQGDFTLGIGRVYKYTPRIDRLEIVVEFNLKEVELYNIRLHVAPLMLVAEDTEKGTIEIYYPERLSLKKGEAEDFMFREGNRFYFSKWIEEGYDEKGKLVAPYKYYDMYLIKDKDSNILEEGIGCIETMPDGKKIIV